MALCSVLLGDATACALGDERQINLGDEGHRPGNGQAVGCYIVHEKIVRAIHQKLYVIF